MYYFGWLVVENMHPKYQLNHGLLDNAAVGQFWGQRNQLLNLKLCVFTSLANSVVIH
jgi:hypothetical protein